jgi:LysR family transcriptional regulator, nitrogen assimilation regulatory protein
MPEDKSAIFQIYNFYISWSERVDQAAWKLFLDAAELGSLSKVAVSNGTSQPQVSRIIRDLELNCGGPLFQRNGRGVTLTELGERIAPRVRAWLASTDELANDIRSVAGTPVGKVRIGSLPSTAHPLLTEVYMRLKADFPLIQLTVREGQGAQLETWLDEGSVDLALLFRMSPTPKNGDVYLSQVPTFLVGAAGDRLTSKPTVEFSAVHNLPLVLFCRPSSWRNRLEDIATEHGVALNVVLEADSLSLQTSIAAAGEIYALLGPNAVAAASRTFRLQASRLVAPTIHRHVALAMSPRVKSNLASQTVMRVITETMKAGGA